jgi:hypothetical protein
MEQNLNKKELVYWSTDYNDGEFKTLSIFCMENNLRLVLILPLCQQYTPIINDCFNILGDDLLIYEIGMGMGNTLKARADSYVAYHKQSSLYE